MRLRLQRMDATAETTLGALFDITNGESRRRFLCFTLEDECRAVKVKGETRIPAGEYAVELRKAGEMHARYSRGFPWHIGMLWLRDVPGFEWIYIHVGNTDEDTSGCILVGQECFRRGDGSWALRSSRAAYVVLYHEVSADAARGNLSIEVVD